MCDTALNHSTGAPVPAFKERRIEAAAAGPGGGGDERFFKERKKTREIAKKSSEIAEISKCELLARAWPAPQVRGEAG